MEMICSVCGDEFQRNFNERSEKCERRKSKNIMAAWASIYNIVLFSFDDVT